MDLRENGKKAPGGKVTPDKETTMVGRWFILFLVAQGMAAVFNAHAQERIFVRAPAVFDKTAPIADSVKAECAVDTLLGQQVYARVSEKFPGSAQVRELGEAGKNKVLNLTILSVHGVGGGSWSGPKSISLRADLMQDNQVIATTMKQRSSTGGVFGGVTGTCAIMERIAVALGRDVVAWLASPASAPASVPVKPAAAEANSAAAAPKAEDIPAAPEVPSKSPAGPEEKIN